MLKKSLFLLWVVLCLWVCDLLAAYTLTREIPLPFAYYKVASALFLLMFVALVPHRFVSRGLLLVIATGIFILSYIDVLYYRAFQALPSIYDFSAVGQLGDTSDSIWSLVKPLDQIFLYVFAACMAGILVCGRLLNLPEARGSFRLSTAVFIACAAFSFEFVKSTYHWMNHRYSWKVFSSEIQFARGGIWFGHLRDLSRQTRELLIVKRLGSSSRAALATYIGGAQHPIDAKVGDDIPNLKGKNIVFLSVEGLQQFVVNLHVAGKPVMPTLNSLAKDFIYAENIFNQTGGSPTSDCEFLALNSLHPLLNGAVAFRRAGNEFVALPGILREHGYTTISAHANNPGFWNRGVVHAAYGFQHTWFKNDFTQQARLGWGLADDVFLTELANKLARAKKPFFNYAITLSSHHPYNYLPFNIPVINVAELTGSMLGNYLQSMNYVDQSLNAFLSRMSELNLLKNTVFFIFGDHNAKLEIADDEAEFAARLLSMSPEQINHVKSNSFLTDKVPLIIVDSTRTKPQVIAKVGGQIDFAPTVLAGLGIAAPPSFFGHSLFSPATGGFVSKLGQNAADADLIYSRQPKPICFSTQEKRNVSLARCQALRDRSAQHFFYSNEVVLHNLAPQMDELVSQAD